MRAIESKGEYLIMGDFSIQGSFQHIYNSAVNGSKKGGELGEQVATLPSKNPFALFVPNPAITGPAGKYVGKYYGAQVGAAKGYFESVGNFFSDIFSSD